VKYRLRWTVAGAVKSTTYTTRALADSRRAELLSATRRGEAFDVATGLPVSQLPDERGTTWWEWVLAYVDLKWPALAPNSRRSTAEALSCATLALLPRSKSNARPTDAVLGSAMRQWAFNAPRRAAGPPPEDLAPAVAWLERSCPRLRELENAAVVRAVLDAFARRQDGTPAAATVIARKRAVLHNVLELAVERELFVANPLDRVRWKAPKVNEAFDPRAVVDPVRARALLEAVGALADLDEARRKVIGLGIRGRRLVAFFTAMYYSALRPSEALALRETDLDLPPADDRHLGEWGELLVSRSDAEVSGSWTDGGRRTSRQLKHRARGEVRVVPCPPPLVQLLQAHLEEYGVAPDGRLFRGPYGGHVSAGTYTDVWDAARKKALNPAEYASQLAARPYDLRHTAVSTWLAGGVESAQVAAWAGHSVAVLHRVYAHVLTGRSEVARQQIARILGLSPNAGASG